MPRLAPLTLIAISLIAPISLGQDPPKRQHVVESSPQEEGSDDPNLIKISWNGMRNVDLKSLNLPSTWSLVPDGVAQANVQTDIALKGQAPRKLFVARNAPRAVVQHDQHGVRGGTQIEIVDLAAGKSTALLEIPPKLLLIDFSPDGKVFVLQSTDLRSKRIEFWTINDDGTAAAGAPCYPYGEINDPWRIDRITFVDANHFLMLRHAKLVLLKYPEMKAIWTTELDGVRYYWPSPGGKYLLVRSLDAKYQRRQPILLDTLTGKPLGIFDPGEVVDDPPMSFHHSVAWTPSGKSIVFMDDHNVRVWDITKGKVSDFFGNSLGRRIWGGPNFSFTSETTALIETEGEILFDFARRVPLWQYRLPREARDMAIRVAADGRTWYALQDARSKEYFLIGQQLPDAQAKAMATTLDTDESLLLLKPGAVVSLVINMPDAPPPVRDKVRASLKSKLAKLNVQIKENQPVVVEARTAAGALQEAFYGFQDRPPQEAQKVRYTVKKSTIILRVNDDIAWETARWDQPEQRIRLNPGESLQQAINRLSQPDYDFYERAEIPQYVAKPNNPFYFGTSKLQPEGAITLNQANAKTPKKVDPPKPEPQAELKPDPKSVPSTRPEIVDPFANPPSRAESTASTPQPPEPRRETPRVLPARRGDSRVKTLAAAIDALSSTDDSVQLGGAQWVAENPPMDEKRAVVLDLLKPKLNVSDHRARATFVSAFARWADGSRCADLESVLEFPKESGSAFHDKIWASVIPALLRLDFDSAQRAVDRRGDSFHFRNAVTRVLQPIAEMDGQTAKNAQALIERVKTRK